MSYGNLNVSKDLGQNLKVNDIKCNTLEADTIIFNDVEVNKLTLTTNQGITSDIGVNLEIYAPIDQRIDISTTGTGDMNIDTHSTLGIGQFANVINLGQTAGTVKIGQNATAIQIGNGGLAPVKIGSDLTLKNAYTTIATTSVLNGYSTGTFANSVGGGGLSPVAITIRYCRIGQRVDLFLPGFVIALDATPTAIRTLSSIPAELISTASDFPSVVTSATAGSNVNFSTANFNTTFNKVFWYKGQGDGWSTADGPSVIISACTLSYMIF